MNSLKKIYASFLLLASLMSLSSIETYASSGFDDTADNVKDYLLPGLSQKEKDIFFTVGIVSTTTAMLVTLMGTYFIKKKAENKTEEIVTMLKALENEFPLFPTWISKNKKIECIISAIEHADADQVIYNYKTVKNRYNQLLTQYNYLQVRRISINSLITTATSLAVQKKLGVNYQKLEDAIDFSTLFLQAAQYKYTDQQIKLLEHTPYFMIKSANIETKAANLFPKFFNTQAKTCSQSMMKLYALMTEISTELTAHRNALLTMDANNQNNEVMNRIELFLYQIDEDYKQINTKYRLPLPIHLRNPLTHSNATIADPGVMPKGSQQAQANNVKLTLIERLKSFFSRKKPEASNQIVTENSSKESDIKPTLIQKLKSFFSRKKPVEISQAVVENGTTDKNIKIETPINNQTVPTEMNTKIIQPEITVEETKKDQIKRIVKRTFQVLGILGFGAICTGFIIDYQNGHFSPGTDYED